MSAKMKHKIPRKACSIRHGIIRVRENDTDDAILSALKQEFHKVFVDWQSWDKPELAIRKAHTVRQIMAHNGIKRYHPVLVSTASIPEAERGRVSRLLQDSSISMVAADYEHYTKVASSLKLV